MFRNFLCGLSLLLASSVFAGDTLQSFLERMPHDTSGVRQLIKASDNSSLIDYSVAISCAKKALSLANETGYPSAIVDASLTMGIRTMNEGNYVDASGYLFKGLQVADSIHYGKGMLMANNSIGNLYAHQDQYEAALKYYEIALKLAQEQKNRVKEGVILGNLGNIYYMQSEGHGENLQRAKNYYEQYLAIVRELDQKERIITALNNLTLVYGDLGEYDRAIKTIDTVMTYILPLNDSADLAYAFANYGRMYRLKGEFAKAIDYVNRSIRVCQALNNRDELVENYQSLAICYEKMGDYKNAYLYSVKHTELKDELISIANTSIINDLKTKMESDRQESKINELQNQNEIASLTNSRKNLYLILAIGGFILLSAFAFLLYNRYKVKSESNRKLEEQNHIIAEKNKDITDSINYASRIQESLLASEEVMKLVFPDIFIFFRPRDIVSGDFWWVTRKGDETFLCVADCTGHGVPGAFMSLLCISFLNEAVNEKHILEPDQIFNYVRDRIVASLAARGKEQYDGMDGVLCRINSSTREVVFAASNNPLWHLRGNDLTEFKADKISVGRSFDNSKPFTRFTIRGKQGDVIYLFSDGYADQFGGPRGKKFKYKPLQGLLLKNAFLPFETQRSELERTHLEWKGDHAQVDDILVAGIRL